MVSVLTHVVRTESVRGLWKGLGPSLVRCVPGVGIYFCTLHSLRESFFRDRAPSALDSLLLGLSARTISAVCMLPVTVVKTRYESGRFKYRSVLGALSSIRKTEGIRALFSGLTATLARDAPFSGIYVMIYTQAKHMLLHGVEREGQAPTRFACGVLAGVVASLVTQPADTIKTYMQMEPHRFSHTGQTFVAICRSQGLTGLFHGAVPRCLRRTLVTAMAWTVYERMMVGLGLKT
ncbi:mitochondrial glycine transporter isoform X2 [Petromyzon marinus]|nr:mitochondrial glycine transporter isoform X2 [Petromyzon marinus]XP_032830704.1 mitochondrial glycine transporter isoform X2 [Petromyzon marinus]